MYWAMNSMGSAGFSLVATLRAATNCSIKLASRYSLIGSYGFTDCYKHSNKLLVSSVFSVDLLWLLTCSGFLLSPPKSDPASIHSDIKRLVLIETRISVGYLVCTYLTFLLI
jgi:hypothetical protein